MTTKPKAASVQIDAGLIVRIDGEAEARMMGRRLLIERLLTGALDALAPVADVRLQQAPDVPDGD